MNRNTEHKPTVVKLPASYRQPRKRLSHTTKYRGRGMVTGYFRKLWRSL